MRIAYLTQIDMAGESGPLRKTAEQLTRWQEAGHAVALFPLLRQPRLWDGLAGLDVRPLVHASRLERIRAAPRIAVRVVAYRPDVVYLRFASFYPHIWLIGRRLPMVAEINTLDVAEFRRQLPLAPWLYHVATRRLVFHAATGFVALSREIARQPEFSRRPTLVLANGIDFRRYGELRPGTDGKTPRLVFVGHAGQPWHGVDKLVALARLAPDWRFDVVGYGPGDLPQPLPANLAAHGPLPLPRYLALLAEADVAVATLAYHRIAMREGSPLKLREYLAMGLPSITAFTDTDFPDGAPFLLRLANTEDNIAGALPEIRAFVAAWRGRRVPRQALAHLDIAEKERQRLAFLDDLANR
jgi:glycosyltransferase involved in cell wall biosynthesis